MKRTYRRTSGLILLISVFCIFSYGQTDNLLIEKISIESGLSQSTVLCIYQDKKDFWGFGTFEGLNQYDWNNFKLYRFNPVDFLDLSKNKVKYLKAGQNSYLKYKFNQL